MNSEFRRSEAFKVETEAFVVMRNLQPIAIIHDETAYTKFIKEDCAVIMETDG